MKKIEIPKKIIDDVVKQLSDVKAEPWDERETVCAYYDDENWLVEADLKYDLRWTYDTDGAGRPYYEYESTPREMNIETCLYFHDPHGDQQGDDYSDELYDELFKYLKPEV